MIPRRDLVTGGLLGGVIGALGGENPEAAPVAAAGADDDLVAKVVQAIGALRTEVQALKSFPEIAPVRDAQLAYLRANGRFPDYLEIGTSIWFGVHDWHVRWQQPLSLGRDNVGRYTLLFGPTLLIMRVDAAPAFVGVPYDNR